MTLKDDDWGDSLDDADGGGWAGIMLGPDYEYTPPQDVSYAEEQQRERDQALYEWECKEAERQTEHYGQPEPDYDDPFSHLYYIPEYNFYISKHQQSNELKIVAIQTDKGWDSYNITNQSFEYYNYNDVPYICSGNNVTEGDIDLCVTAYLANIKTNSYDREEKATDYDEMKNDDDIPF